MTSQSTADSTELAKRALRELVHAGGDSALSAVSRLLGGTPMSSEQARYTAVGSDPALNRQLDSQGVVLSLAFQGSVSGAFVLLIPESDAINLSRALLTQYSLSGVESEGKFEPSALMEVSNIAVCAFLDAAAAMIGEPLVPGPRQLHEGVLADRLNEVCSEHEDAILVTLPFGEERDLCTGLMGIVLPAKQASLALTRMGIVEGYELP